MVRLLPGIAWLLLPALAVMILHWRVPLSWPTSATEIIQPPSNRLLQALPSTPGCWVRSPSSCPSQQPASWVPTSSGWMQDGYGEQNLNAAGDRSVCEGRRRQDYNFWCGSSDAETYFVPPVSQASTSGPAVPSTPGCWVRSPNGCPNQQPSLWVPTSSGWMQDEYGEQNLNAAGDRSVCEGRRRQDYNYWCGSSDTETYFVPSAAQAVIPMPSPIPTPSPTFGGCGECGMCQTNRPCCCGPYSSGFQCLTGAVTGTFRTFCSYCNPQQPSPSPGAWKTAMADHMSLERASTTGLAVPSSPGCWVRSPSGCPSQQPASWVPTSSGWMQDGYGEQNLNAAGDRSICEGRRRQDYNFWCGSSDAETHFVPPVSQAPTPMPSLPGVVNLPVINGTLSLMTSGGQSIRFVMAP
eukprot:TRINITY_DN22936_c0_g3_i1.p1 TRINITY_DN22936_c0_g3~~TRINITY_DN22936_c0_g3_i1.p1  ORF type:complete len:409 (-),score=22.28 TRINITY_DN22936_c0_g3_i1:81-1307(-)